MNESLEAAALRELQEETGLKDISFQQLGAFGNPGRDPRGRTITVAYFVLLNAERLQPRADDDASKVQWWSMDRLPKLAFDHDRILDVAWERLVLELERAPIGTDLLPPKFPFRDLVRIHEIICKKKVDARRLRKTLLERRILRSHGSGPATRGRLYSFVKR
jgi:8-oxo-dGTP diphosphatase